MKVNGKLVQIARVKKGWTQGQLAAEVKRHLATISRLEHGNASVQVIRDVAKRMGLKIEDLLNLPDPPCVCNRKHTETDE